MEKEKIERINFLARTSKERPLTNEELAEQKTLREEYLADFRAQFAGILDNTVVQTPDGKKEKLDIYMKKQGKKK